MFVLSSMKNALRTTVARHRRSAVMLGLHQAASFFESAWRNEGSEFSENGERFVLAQLAAADFRVAIDAGANLGQWSLAAVDLWPNCHIHAFEVAPETFKALEQKTCLQRSRLALHGMGLSDEPGTQTMYYFPQHSQLTCDTPRHESYESVPFDAKLTTLDAFCQDNKINMIDYLKIDVEGAEHRVLKGAHGLLAGDKIACIQFEYGAFSIQTRYLLKDYYALLSKNFVIGKIFPNYVAFGDYDWTTEDFRFSNYLCTSRSRPDLKQLLERN